MCRCSRRRWALLAGGPPGAITGPLGNAFHSQFQSRKPRTKDDSVIKAPAAAKPVCPDKAAAAAKGGAEMERKRHDPGRASSSGLLPALACCKAQLTVPAAKKLSEA